MICHSNNNGECNAPLFNFPIMIIQNALKVKDTIIVSKHNHDYVEYDGIFIDGGTDYIRTNYTYNKFEPTYRGDVEELFIDSSNSIDEIKNKLVWGSYGVDADGVSEFHNWRNKVKELLEKDNISDEERLEIEKSKPERIYKKLIDCSLEHLENIIDGEYVEHLPLYKYIIQEIINDKKHEKLFLK